MGWSTEASERAHWGEVSAHWDVRRPQRLWRAHSDAVNISLCRRWWPARPVRRVLKTDAFDEAFGHGLVAFLRSRAREVQCIDYSVDIARCACLATGTRSVAAADVRRLPFAEGAFDLIVSNSTLDHFRIAGDIRTSLTELHRVLAPGGSLILTLDNPSNPVVALRNGLPFALIRRLGLVPYYVGVTCDAARGAQLLTDTAFIVRDRTAILHCPRAAAIAAAAAVDWVNSNALRRMFLRAAAACEGLERSGARYRTGYFGAFLAEKAGPVAR